MGSASRGRPAEPHIYPRILGHGERGARTHHTDSSPTGRVPIDVGEDIIYSKKIFFRPPQKKMRNTSYELFYIYDRATGQDDRTHS